MLLWGLSADPEVYLSIPAVLQQNSETSLAERNLVWTRDFKKGEWAYDFEFTASLDQSAKSSSIFSSSPNSGLKKPVGKMKSVHWSIKFAPGLSLSRNIMLLLTTTPKSF